MGRPQLYGSPGVRRGVLLREETVEALDAVASKQGRPMSRLMADAIEQYLGTHAEDFEPLLRPDCPDDSQPKLELDGDPDGDLEACA